MRDTTLFLIACCVSLAGFLGLVLASFLEPELYEISDVVDRPDGSKVRVRAAIEDVQSRGSVTILGLRHLCTIDAVLFEPVNLTENACVLVSGSRSTYNGNPQIIVDRIVLC